MPPLPESLRNSVRIAWHISSWCNYSCEYCGVFIFRQRSKTGKPQTHAFDHYSATAWVKAFEDFPQERIYLKITGGEPFLDRRNMRTLLAGLMASERFTLRIDTNGFWNPEFFRAIPKERILLNISYHPQQTEFGPFRARLRAIRDAGFRIAMVNFVLAPENRTSLELAMRELQHDGLFVNVGGMIPAGRYASREDRDAAECDVLEEYTPPIDVHYRVVNPVTRGRLCYHPAMSYYLRWDGQIQVYCLDGWRNLMTEGPPPLPREAVPCPAQHCEGCMEMYRSLADEPLASRSLSLYTLDEYAAEVRDYRKSRRWRRWLPGIRRSSSLLPAPVPDAVPLISPDQIRPALPDGAIFGYLDSANGARQIEARSRDRLAMFGWAASRASGAPLKRIRLVLNDRTLCEVTDFHPRPDVVSHFGRPELLKSGWRTMFYLPALADGEHQIRIEGADHAGNEETLGSVSLHIAD